MAKSSDPAGESIAAAQQRLKAAHAKLVEGFQRLHQAKFDAASHRAYLEKLKAHLSALEAHTAAIHAEHEAVYGQRKALHEQHDSPAHTAGPGKKRSTSSR